MANPSISIAFNSRLLNPIKPEPSQPPPKPPPSTVKPEPQDSPPQELQCQQPLKEPQFLNSISQLTSLSSAIDIFNRRFIELQNHLDFIQQAIHTRSTQLPHMSEAPPAPPAPAPQQNTEMDTVAEKIVPPPLPKSEVRSLCEMMCGKGLRKYVISNLHNVQALRQEVPMALRYAPKPAKLVLDCVGRFYLQGKKAYTKDSPMIPARDACILVLEFFLLSLEDEVLMDGAVKQEAESAAVSWRRRLITEGGVRRVSEIDAKGLLLLIACYGIPKLFSDEDIWDLATRCDSKSLGEALRKSRVLVKRVSDVLDGMMKRGMKVEAVDVAYTFGIDDKFPPRKLLTSILREYKESSKSRRRDTSTSPTIQKEANEKELTALKSVLKYIEDRELDPIKLLPGWQLKEMIIKLEKDIADLNKQMDEKVIAKRKADENELSNSTSQETKRTRFSARVSPWVSSSGIGMLEQRIGSHVDDQSSYIGLRQMHILDGGLSSHNNNYPAPGSVPYGAPAASLPENVIGKMAGGGVTHASRVGLSAVYGVASTGSSTGVQRETLVDRAGQGLANTGLLYGWHGAAEAVLSDGSRGQSFGQHPTSGLLRPSSMENFAGLPNSSPTVAATRNSASDLYGFADSVVEGAYTNAQNPNVLLPSGVGSHHSAYVIHQ